ncbi:hypothetical protein CY34DRAFT_814603 [Suillus luteus UH-Slu-Lm8-n1]|uniref:Uncharacterized protein n=1 Tax=Suillus luteus UH-Slu-Lm8-n1 TaxID=930992 RepID=A0A0C9Z1I7_9AGAM|nr:hypothetical protein CY34DRAFT_814603 [Suillus luteus UH-Slu-Lm8-n1]
MIFPALAPPLRKSPVHNIQEALGIFHPAGVEMIQSQSLYILHAPQGPHLLRASSQAPAVSQVTRDIHILSW